jgi:lipopolysaccharide transport system permease protein
MWVVSVTSGNNPRFGRAHKATCQQVRVRLIQAVDQSANAITSMLKGVTARPHDQTTLMPTLGEARSPLPASGLRGLWHGRWLLLEWVRRDFVVRYRQSGLGLAWAILQPALLLLFYGIVFTRFLHVNPHDGSYVVFAYCGLAPWTFLASSVTWGVQALPGAAPIIKQVAFPRAIIPLAAAGVICMDLLIGTVVLVVLQLAMNHRLHLSTLGIVPIYLGLILVTSALTIFTSIAGAFVRDIRFVIPLLLQVGFIATPIMYDTSAAGSSSRLLTYNPMSSLIEGMRASVIDGKWPSIELCASLIGGGALLLFLAISYCASVQDRLSDLV